MRKIILNFTYLLLFLLSLNSCHHISYISKKYNSEIILDSNYIEHDLNTIEILSKDTTGYTFIKTFTKDSNLVSLECFDNEIDRNYIGESKYWYPNGSLKKTIIYKNKNFYSEVKTYYTNGVLKREDYFKDKGFISGKCYDSLGNIKKHSDYEKEPQINEGNYSKCLKYPESLRQQGIEEIVVLKVFISKYGKVIKLKYDKSNSKEFVEEAIKCLKNLNKNSEKNFLPCFIDDEPVDCWVHIPVRFLLTIFGF